MIDIPFKSQLKAVKRMARDRILQPEISYRLYLKYKYHVSSPRGYPERTTWNAVLQTRQEWEAALRQVARLGLSPHGDTPKNWDSLVALDCILRKTNTDAHILDAGAELYSMILPWLYLYGYKHLTGINLVFDRPVRRGFIRYEYGDITNTRFAENTFDAVTCLSVVEHGLNLEAYFREVARILKPGGIVITSTDYFADPTDTGDKCAYGVPVHVFTRDEIANILSVAGTYGLELTGIIDLNSNEKTVRWQQLGLDFTFLVITLQKTCQARKEIDGNPSQGGQ